MAVGVLGPGAFFLFTRRGKTDAPPPAATSPLSGEQEIAWRKFLQEKGGCYIAAICFAKEWGTFTLSNTEPVMEINSFGRPMTFPDAEGARKEVALIAAAAPIRHVAIIHLVRPPQVLTWGRNEGGKMV